MNFKSKYFARFNQASIDFLLTFLPPYFFYLLDFLICERKKLIHPQISSFLNLPGLHLNILSHAYVLLLLSLSYCYYVFIQIRMVWGSSRNASKEEHLQSILRRLSFDEIIKKIKKSSHPCAFAIEIYFYTFFSILCCIKKVKKKS